MVLKVLKGRVFDLVRIRENQATIFLTRHLGILGGIPHLRVAVNDNK